MKMVSSKVKNDGMQNKDNKRQFTPNKQLMKILNMSKARTITFVELNKHLSTTYFGLIEGFNICK